MNIRTKLPRFSIFTVRNFNEWIWHPVRSFRDPASVSDFRDSTTVLHSISVIRHPYPTSDNQQLYQNYVMQPLHRLMSFSNFTVCEIRESAAVQIAIYVIQHF